MIIVGNEGRKNLARRSVLRVAMLVVLLVLFIKPAYADFGLKWPFEPGPTWKIQRGYNYKSHSGYQRYSFDLIRDDGKQSGKPVLAGVKGKIVWQESATGCTSNRFGSKVISGKKYYFFLMTCHVIYSKNWSGKDVSRGTKLGTVAPRGQAGSGGIAHIHLTIYRTTNSNGGSGRIGVPFSGDCKIDGYNFPSHGTPNEYKGKKGLKSTNSTTPTVDQNFYLYYSPQTNTGQKMAGYDLWNIPEGNDRTSVDGVDINGDGVDEIAVLRDKGGSDQNLHIYSTPVCGQGATLIAGDWWSPNGKTRFIATGNFDSDSKAEIAYLKNPTGRDWNLYIENAPTKVAQDGSFVGGDWWSYDTPVGKKNLDIAAVDIDGDGRDEIALLRDDGGDVNLYIFPAPQGVQDTSMVASNKWEIPDGGTFAIAGGDFFAASSGEEIAAMKKVMKSWGWDYNLYIYQAPTSKNQHVAQHSYDLWNIPSGNNARSIAGVSYGLGPELVGVLKDGGSGFPGCTEPTRWTIVQLPGDESANVCIAPASGGGLQIIIDGLGGVSRWVTGVWAAIKKIFGFSTLIVSWEQYDKAHSLHLGFLIEGVDEVDRLLVYSANASNHWGRTGWVDMGPRSPTYNQWESFTRNLKNDYIDEFGVAPKLGKEIRVGHFVNDSWVGDHGGTVRNITFAVDTSSPVTTISFDPGAPNGENDWYVSDVAVTLTATDPSGVQKIEYNLGSGWTTYIAPFTISQEGATNILYRAVDTFGNQEADKSATVKLDKTPPIASADGPYSGAEGSAVALDGSSSSDAVSGIQNYTWTSSSLGPYSGSNPAFTWGDNGSFTVALTVKDMAGWEASTSSTATITNVDPTVSLDRSRLVSFFGGDALVSDISGSSFQLTATDPGSDDITVNWDFGDTTTSSDLYLNDPLYNPDPAQSPEINPRNLSVSKLHQYNVPDVYTLSLDATDDDSGVGTDSATLVVTGTATEVRTTGFWASQYEPQGEGVVYSDDFLWGFWGIVKFVSKVFDEAVSATTFLDIRWILTQDGSDKPMIDQAHSKCLATLLNFASGSMGWSEQVDTNFDLVPDAPYSSAITQAEDLITSPTSTNTEYEQAKDICDSINNMGQ